MCICARTRQRKQINDGIIERRSLRSSHGCFRYFFGFLLIKSPGRAKIGQRGMCRHRRLTSRIRPIHRARSTLFSRSLAHRAELRIWPFMTPVHTRTVSLISRGSHVGGHYGAITFCHGTSSRIKYSKGKIRIFARGVTRAVTSLLRADVIICRTDLRADRPSLRSGKISKPLGIN